MNTALVRRPSSAIFIRITHRGKTRYVTTGIKVSEALWLESSARVRRKNYATIKTNQELDRIEEVVASVTAPCKTATEAQAAVRSALSRQDEDFIAYAERVVETYREKGMRESRIRMSAIVSKAKDYAGGTLPFNAVTKSWLRGYEAYLLGTVGNSRNTVVKNLRGLRTIVNRAIDDGYVDQADYPFRGYKLIEERSHKVRLTNAELARLEEFAAAADPQSEEGLAANCFIADVYVGGARIGDLAALTLDNLREDTVEYISRKTKVFVRIPITDRLQEILDRYPGGHHLLPIVRRPVRTDEQFFKAYQSTNSQINRALKRIARQLDFPRKLTFHCARHTFADMARRAGWPIYDVSKALGHKSMRETERYLAEFDDGDLGSQFGKMFSLQHDPAHDLDA